MKLFLATDIHIAQMSDRYYAKSQFSSILTRYCTNFGKVKLCCRVDKVETLTSDQVDVTELLDSVLALNSQSRALAGSYNKPILDAMADCDLVVARTPAILAYRAADCAKKLGKPCFAESMGCAWDAYWNHGLAGKLIAPYMFFKMKSVVCHADYALYVTREFLQNRYPCKNESVSASNVRIDAVDPAVLEQRLKKISSMPEGAVTLMTTAAVDVRYKGQEYVIRAIPLLNQAGIRVRYILIGGGSQDYLRGVSQKYGVADQVEFAGRKPLAEVFTLLEQADIYIQPSLQEGLPRSVIEAMSRGCPAIGARTAGIPELIAPECVVRRKSAKDIAARVLAITKDKEKMSALAKENFATAGEYLDEALTARRNAYFERIKRELNDR